jgi:hypothetical protein
MLKHTAVNVLKIFQKIFKLILTYFTYTYVFVTEAVCVESLHINPPEYPWSLYSVCDWL